MLGYLGRLMTGIVGYDSRVLRSFIGLLFRPGLLTVEYIRGRRIHYVEPLQIYLLSAAAFFLVHAYRPFIQFNTETGGATSTLGPASATGNLSETAIQRIEAQGYFSGGIRGAVRCLGQRLSSGAAVGSSCGVYALDLGSELAIAEDIRHPRGIYSPLVGVLSDSRGRISRCSDSKYLERRDQPGVSGRRLANGVSTKLADQCHQGPGKPDYLLHSHQHMDGVGAWTCRDVRALT